MDVMKMVITIGGLILTFGVNYGIFSYQIKSQGVRITNLEKSRNQIAEKLAGIEAGVNMLLKKEGLR